MHMPGCVCVCMRARARGAPVQLLLTGAAPQCWHVGCPRLGIFGHAGRGKERFCSAHRRPDDVNLRNKRCCALGCLRSPSFGDPAAVTAGAKGDACVRAPAPPPPAPRSDRCACTSRRCVCCDFRTGAGSDMWCGETGVGKARAALYCKLHSPPGWIDVRNRKCDQCNRRSATSEGRRVRGGVGRGGSAGAQRSQRASQNGGRPWCAELLSPQVMCPLPWITSPLPLSMTPLPLICSPPTGQHGARGGSRCGTPRRRWEAAASRL